MAALASKSNTSYPTLNSTPQKTAAGMCLTRSWKINISNITNTPAAVPASRSVPPSLRMSTERIVACAPGSPPNAATVALARPCAASSLLLFVSSLESSRSWTILSTTSDVSSVSR